LTGRARLAATLLATAAATAVIVAAPATAEARIVDLRVGGTAGGMFGWGTGSSASPDFFRQSAGPGFGFEMGAKLLVIDMSLSFLQLIDSGGLSGTLIQLLLGTEIDIPVGPHRLPNGQSINILHAGIAAGVALGTGATVEFPIDNEQVADKGIVSRFRFGYEAFLNPFMGVGAQLDFGYHYFLAGQPINGSDHASGFHIIGLGTLTFHLGR
jgi:hypothetical protein